MPRPRSGSTDLDSRLPQAAAIIALLAIVLVTGVALILRGLLSG